MAVVTGAVVTLGAFVFWGPSGKVGEKISICFPFDFDNKFGRSHISSGPAFEYFK